MPGYFFNLTYQTLNETKRPIRFHTWGKWVYPSQFPAQLPTSWLWRWTVRASPDSYMMLTCLSPSQNFHTPGTRCAGGSGHRYPHSHFGSHCNSSLGQTAPDISSQCAQPAQRRRLERKEDSGILNMRIKQFVTCRGHWEWHVPLWLLFNARKRHFAGTQALDVYFINLYAVCFGRSLNPSVLQWNKHLKERAIIFVRFSRRSTIHKILRTLALDHFNINPLSSPGSRLLPTL